MTTTTPPLLGETEGREKGTATQLIAFALVIVLLSLAGWAVGSRVLAPESAAVGQGPAGEMDQSRFAGATGIWIEHVALIGGSGLIEIRYRILDVDRSEIVHDFDNPPRITMQGYTLDFQRHEHSHDRDNRLGGTYNEQLVNLGNVFQRGDVVDVWVGDYVLEGVTIQ